MKYLKLFKMLAILTILNCQNSSSVLLPDGTENLKGNPEYREMENYLKKSCEHCLFINPNGFLGFNKNRVFFKMDDYEEISSEPLMMFKDDEDNATKVIFERFYAKFEQKDKQALQAERARTAAQIARLEAEKNAAKIANAAQIARLEAEKKAAEIANAAQKASSEAEIARLRQEVADMDAKFEEIYQNLIPKNTWN